MGYTHQVHAVSLDLGYNQNLSPGRQPRLVMVHDPIYLSRCGLNFKGDKQRTLDRLFQRLHIHCFKLNSLGRTGAMSFLPIFPETLLAPVRSK